ncbi:MAG: hypothetical protein ACRD6X_11955 [Pyrinomonadaceae bacterium]
MTNLEQAIIDKVHRFPLEKQQKVLDYADSLETNGAESTIGGQTLWESVRHIIEEIPKEEWDKLPTDGSINVDHYLYGHPKKSK